MPNVNPPIYKVMMNNLLTGEVLISGNRFGFKGY